MTEPRVSLAVQTAWRIAGVLALETGSKEIEPLHLLYGLCNLERSSENETSFSGPSDVARLRIEAEQIGQLLNDAGADLGEIRKKARGLAGQKMVLPVSADRPTPHIPRSDASRQVLAKAAEISRGDETSSIGLLAALCNSGSAQIAAALGSRIMEIGKLATRYASVSQLRNAGRAIRNFDTGQDSSASREPDTDVTILEAIDANKRVPESQPLEDVGKRLTLLCDLVWEFGTEGSLDAMLQRALDELLRVVPTAEHGAILVRVEQSEELSLKAHSAGLTPRLSMNSVRRAIAQKAGFLWKKSEDLSRSQKETNLEAGLYVPMLADSEVFGVICLGTSRAGVQFQRSDLQLVNALAHQLGLAIAHHELRRELRLNAKLMERLLTNFSPKVRTRLLQRARLGRLQLGGERAEVSIVCSDIRGFTRISANLDAEDVVELVNDYFAPLVDKVFQHDGTINNFVGDAILAVFGSPESDPRHNLKALTAAMQMQEAAGRVSAKRIAQGKVGCEIGIGVHCGEVVHGFIGSNECMEYTVIGDVVNYAARYCDGASGGEILLSPTMHQRVWERVEALKIAIDTKHEGTLSAYRVIRLR